MALPTGTTRGSGLSRSEAAIAAWKKRARAAPKTTGGLAPNVAARVREILAGKKKGKGKKAPDPAKAKEKAAKLAERAAAKQEREKAKAERTASASAKKQEREKAKAERVAAQVAKHQEAAKKKQASLQAAHGKAKEKAKAAKEKAGSSQAKQQAQQQHKTRVLSEKIKRGEKLSASDQVDAEDAGLTQPAKKAINMTETGVLKITPTRTFVVDMEVKAGARHSKTDMQHLQGIHDSAVACGAACAPGDEPGDDVAAVAAIKSIMDDPGYYAQHECNDIMQACSALQTLTILIQSELSEEDEDIADISQLVDAARILVKFVGSELDEMESAAEDDVAEDANEPVPMAKAIELGTLDNGEKVATVSGYAIKAIGDAGMVGGYLVKFGGDGDLSQFRDVFTAHTNYGGHRKSDVWVHHRMLPGIGKQQLTNQAELGMDDEGVFVKHLLDLRNTYEAKLYGMVQAGKLGWSSGTAPHLVERKALGDGRHEVTQWTLGLDASYTPMPAGGFVVNAGAMKSLLDEVGVDLLNAMSIEDSPKAITSDPIRRDGVKMDDERARRLTLELSLMELEETAL